MSGATASGGNYYAYQQAGGGISATPPEEFVAPTVGEKILIEITRWGEMRVFNPLKNQPVNGHTYVEVEVKALRDVKVVIS